MKVAVLESYAMWEGDLCWDGLYRIADEVVIYPTTQRADIPARAAGADGIIINKRRIDDWVLDRLPDLKWIGIIATGTDNIDLEACRRHGVTVANVPGYSTYSVAQMTFALLLAVCQCAERMHRGVQAGFWKEQPEKYENLPLTELYGKTFGVFGYGDIGKAAARMAKGFGMEVIACTRTVRPEYAADGVTFVDFDTLLARSDVLSLHSPLTSQTRQVINATALEKVKPGCILLNTARGGLVDEAAVADACRSGKLYFYAADVTAVEPVPADCPLLGLDNVMITPHVAWATSAALKRLEQIVIRNLESFVAGKPENVVNP